MGIIQRSRVVALVLVTLLSACAPKASDIKTSAFKTIKADYIRCFKGCASFSVSLNRDGSIETPDSFVSSKPARGLLSREQTNEYFEHLPLDALAACTGGHFGHPTNVDDLVLTLIKGNGETLFCLEPASTDPRARTQAGTLAAFVTAFTRDIYFQALNAQRRAISDAIKGGKLDSVELERSPTACLGGLCRAYIVRFTRVGNATLDMTFSPASHCSRIQARAVVPFSELRSAIVPETPYWLQASYPITAVDTQRATITLIGNHEHFVSKGPDAASWDAPFRSLVDRLDQIVMDANWTPPIPQRC